MVWTLCRLCSFQEINIPEVLFMFLKWWRLFMLRTCKTWMETRAISVSWCDWCSTPNNSIHFSQHLPPTPKHLLIFKIRVHLFCIVLTKAYFSQKSFFSVFTCLPLFVHLLSQLSSISDRSLIRVAAALC